MTAQPSVRSGKLTRLLKWVVGLAVLVVLSRHIELRKLLAVLTGALPVLLAAAFAALVVDALLVTHKWRLRRRPAQRPPRSPLATDAPPTGQVAPQPPGSEAGHKTLWHALMFTGARIAGSASMVLLFSLLSHLLATTDYGTFRQVWLVSRNAINIFAVGISLSIYYFIPRLALAQRRTFALQSGLILAVLGGVLSLVLALGADRIAGLMNNPALAPLLRLFALYPLLTLPTFVAESLLLSLERTGTLSAYYVVDRVGLVVVAAAAALLFGRLDVLFGALVVFGAIELVGCIWLIRHVLRGHETERPVWRVREQLAFALPSAISNLADVVNAEIDKLLTSAYFTVEKFATYANGAFEVPFFAVIVGSVSAVLMPRYSAAYHQGDREAVIRLWHDAIRNVALVLIPATALLFVSANALIPLLFSAKYAGSVVIFQIYLLALLPKLAWYGPTLVSMGYNRAPLRGSVVAVACNALLAFLLIRWIGLVGPAIASVIVAHGLMGYYLVLLARGLHIPVHRVLPLRFLLRVGAVSVVAAALAYPLFAFVPWTTVARLAAGTATFALALAGLYVWAGLVRPEQVGRARAQVHSLLRRVRAT